MNVFLVVLSRLVEAGRIRGGQGGARRALIKPWDPAATPPRRHAATPGVARSEVGQEDQICSIFSRKWSPAPLFGQQDLGGRAKDNTVFFYYYCSSSPSAPSVWSGSPPMSWYYGVKGNGRSQWALGITSNSSHWLSCSDRNLKVGTSGIIAQSKILDL